MNDVLCVWFFFVMYWNVKMFKKCCVNGCNKFVGV